MIKSRLQQDQQAALKTGERLKLNLLRYILAKINNKEIDKHTKLNDDEVITILKQVLKELSETLTAAKKASRPEIIKQTEQEIAYITAYLPQQLSDADLKKAVSKIISDNQSLLQKNPKAIIGICMKNLKTKADSQRILTVFNSLLKNTDNQQ